MVYGDFKVGSVGFMVDGVTKNVGIKTTVPKAPLQIGSDFVFFNNSQEYLIGRNIKEDNGNWTKKVSLGSAASLSFTNTGDLRLNAYTSNANINNPLWLLL